MERNALRMPRDPVEFESELIRRRHRLAGENEQDFGAIDHRRRKDRNEAQGGRHPGRL
jgi:hypothetical protein